MITIIILLRNAKYRSVTERNKSNQIAEQNELKSILKKPLEIKVSSSLSNSSDEDKW